MLWGLVNGKTQTNTPWATGAVTRFPLFGSMICIKRF